MIPWLAISVLIILILLIVLFFALKKGREHKPDYYSFFVMGLVWTIFGFFSVVNQDFSFSGFFAIGLIFLVLGLVNKDKWGKNHKKWKDLDSKEKRIKTILIVLLGVLVLLGLIAWLI